MNSCAVRRPVLFLAVLSFGVSAIITQLALMRELLSAFSGNELVFGIVLGNWMLLTGIGTALGKTATRLKSPLAVLVVLQILIALLPVADVFLLRALRNEIFTRGAEAGVVETVASCFVLMAPYCLATGYVLTLACLVCSGNLPSLFERGVGGDGVTLSQTAKDSASIGAVYFFDNLGGILGGAAFTFVLIHLFSHFGILYFPAFLNLFFAALAALDARRRPLAALAATCTAGLVVLAAAYDLDGLSCKIQFGGQNVVYNGASPYGMLVVTEDAGQYNFIENGVPLFSTHNAEQVEETVHYAMAQRPKAKRVLLVSGGASGTAEEILKYPVEAVDYVELDPLVLEVARRFLPERLKDPRIRVINADGRQYVKTIARGRSAQYSPLPTNRPCCAWRPSVPGEGQYEGYDVVIIDVPDPSTSQINRLYTREFFEQAHRALMPGGVISFSLTGYEGYINKELARLIAVSRRTLGEVFRNVLVLPGTRNFFLASDGDLTPAVADRLERAGISTRLVTRSYLNAMLAPDRMAALRRAFAADAPINEDFNPILYFYHLRYWMSQFQVRFGVFEGILLVPLVVYLVRLRPVPLAIFAGGFAASALEVVLLLGFQILFGSVYHQVGLIVTMFMLGLGAGSLAANRWVRRLGRSHLVAIASAIGAFSLGVPYVLAALGRTESPGAAWAAWAAVPAMTLLLATLVGMEFPLAAKVSFQSTASTASKLYTADYIGAALGALLVSTLLIPVLGVTAVCLLAAGLNLVAAVVMILFRGNG